MKSLNMLTDYELSSINGGNNETNYGQVYVKNAIEIADTLDLTLSEYGTVIGLPNGQSGKVNGNIGGYFSFTAILLLPM